MLSTIQSPNPQKLENVLVQNAKNSQIRLFLLSGKYIVRLSRTPRRMLNPEPRTLNPEP
jgi:hypothetical protein